MGQRLVPIAYLWIERMLRGELMPCESDLPEDARLLYIIPNAVYGVCHEPLHRTALLCMESEEWKGPHPGEIIPRHEVRFRSPMPGAPDVDAVAPPALLGKRA